MVKRTLTNLLTTGKSALVGGSMLLASCVSSPESEYQLMEKSVEYGAQQMQCIRIVGQRYEEKGITLTENELLDKAEEVCSNQDLYAAFMGGTGVLINGVIIYNGINDSGSSAGGSSSTSSGGLGGAPGGPANSSKTITDIITSSGGLGGN